MNILFLPNRKGNNKIITPKEVKILPRAAVGRKGKNFYFLRGDNFIVTRPIG